MVPSIFQMTPLSKIGSPIEEIKPSSADPQEQAKITQAWIDRYKEDFVAHAVWKGNIDKVIEDGAVLPAVAVLKKRGWVEFEKGSTNGSRGELHLVKLNDGDRELFEMLSPDEELVYKELKRKEEKALSSEEKKELEELNQEIGNNLDEEEREAFEELFHDKVFSSKWFQRFRDKGMKEFPVEKKERYFSLMEKSCHFTKADKKELKDLERKKHGIYLFFECSSNDVKYKRTTFERNKRLLKACYTTYIENTFPLTLTYYLTGQDKIHPYLVHKYEKWSNKGISKNKIHEALCGAIDNLFNINSLKLNHEIRTIYCDIAWSYGDCAILRGDTQGVISEENFLGRKKKGNENYLLRPWENKGEYFTLPLAQKDTLLLGPKKDLEPHAKTLMDLNVRFAYLESLTEEQAEFFKVPSRLINENHN